jgi:tryptophan 2,3-dioxygenase
VEALACGHRLADPGQTHYCTYLRVHELLSLQSGPDQTRHPDEHLFVVTHQSFELWFSQLITDLPRAIEALQRDDVGQATWLMRRCAAVVRLFSPTMRMLETMTLGGFYAFRHHLVPASGGESSQWHEIEILSGAREPEFRRYLEAEVNPDPAGAPHSHLWTDRLDLAEALLDYDEEVRCWRFIHARTAERTIGPEVEGTAATSGVRYLERMATHRASFFPFLWGARGQLWERTGAPAPSGAEGGQRPG